MHPEEAGGAPGAASVHKSEFSTLIGQVESQAIGIAEKRFGGFNLRREHLAGHLLREQEIRFPGPGAHDLDGEPSQV